MRAIEFITDQHEDLDEGWKDWVAGAAIGASALGAVDYMTSKHTAPQPTNAVSGTVTAPNPLAKVVRKPEAKALISAAKAANITGDELAQLLAQCAHETDNFTRMKEYGGKLDFRKYDIKHNPRLAKILGNDRAGDGAKFHGRGFMQLTGRENYQKAGRALGLPLEQNPSLVERPDVAAAVAIWYWQNRVKPRVTDFSDTAQVTRPINAGLHGLDRRHRNFTDIVALMSGVRT